MAKFKTYLTWVVFLTALNAPLAQAQLESLMKGPKPEQKATPKESVSINDQLDIWKKQVGEDLDRLAKYTDESVLPPKISLADLEARRRDLERTQLAISRHRDALKSIKENQDALEAAKTTSNEWNGYGDAAPKSILVVDELNNRKQAVLEKKTSDQSSLEIYQRTLNGWLEESKKLETKISEAQKAYDASGEKSHTALWNLEADKEKQRLLFIQSSAMQHTISAIRTSIQRHDVESGLLQKKISEAGKSAVLSEDDIKQIKDASADRQKALKAEIEALRSRQSKATADEEKALANLEKTKAEAAPDPQAIELAKITHEAALARVNTLQQMISSLESFSQIEAFILEAYSQRLIILDSKSTSDERKDAVAALQSLQQRLTAWEIVANNELKAITATISNEQARATAYPAEDPRLSPLNRIRTTLWERQALIQRLTQNISAQIRILDGWLAVYITQNKEGINDKVSDLADQLWASAKRLWNLPINQYEQVIERDGQKIIQTKDVSLGSLVTALILFIIAYLVAARISKRIQRVVVGRKMIGENQARTLRNWLMLVVGFLLALATLNWLNIPLTIFAFLAGALAIGVGFGTQTIIKNFISGIILLFERKIRVGDIVEVDNTTGVVAEINTRSSIIRGFDGIECLIPNSLFLENRVVNWTLNNRQLRREISVGVAYGTAPQDVINILLETAQRHGLVLDDPEPIATLSGFGDNSLNFTLYFWIELDDSTNRLAVESDMRIMIEKRLNESGISIPFPQRNIHLDTSSPLQIQIQPAEEKK